MSGKAEGVVFIFSRDDDAGESAGEAQALTKTSIDAK